VNNAGYILVILQVAEGVILGSSWASHRWGRSSIQICSWQICYLPSHL